jgi:Tfp pilus assembly protein PilF
LLRQRGRIAEAQPIFTQMAKAYPSDFTAVRAYTGFLASQNRASDARAVFEQAVKLAPKVANLRVSYGEFLRAQGRNNDAEKQYKEAISAAAANPFAHYGLANVYLSRGRLTQAEREIDAATKADPRYPRALMLLGHIRSAQQRYTESIEAYNKAITLEVDRARRQELNESIEEAKRASAMLAIQSAQRDIEKNRLKSAWTTYAGVLRIAPEDPSLIEALLKFENQFGTSADVSHLPSSALSSALQTPFWRKLRDAEALWNSGKREDGGRAFFEALDTLSLEDRQKITATAFNVRNENYGIHQIVYRWAMRMIELRDLTGAQNLMESSMRQKIFDFVPGASTTTVASLMSPADTKEPKTFADFEVAHNPDLRAHEILAVLYALQGNNTKSEDFLTALNIEQRVEVRNRIQRLSR